jgi:DNA-binding PadR family transcriptional regulator
MGLGRRLGFRHAHQHGFGGFGPTGRFFGPGELRLALLSLLSEAPAHGYELMTRLEERLGGAYRASAGAIYPTLQQLEDERMVKASERDGRKTYDLLAAGAREAQANAAAVDDIWSRASAREKWGVFRDPDAAEIIGPALRLAKAALKAIARAHGDPEIVDEVREIFVVARQRIERIHETRHGRRRR